MTIIIVRSPTNMYYTEILGDLDPYILRVIRLKEGWTPDEWDFVAKMERSKRYVITFNLMVQDVLSIICSKFEFTLVQSTVYLAHPENQHYLLYILQKMVSPEEQGDITPDEISDRIDSSTETKSLFNVLYKDRGTITDYDKRFYMDYSKPTVPKKSELKGLAGFVRRQERYPARRPDPMSPEVEQESTEKGDEQEEETNKEEEEEESEEIIDKDQHRKWSLYRRVERKPEHTHKKKTETKEDSVMTSTDDILETGTTPEGEAYKPILKKNELPVEKETKKAHFEGDNVEEKTTAIQPEQDGIKMEKDESLDKSSLSVRQDELGKKSDFKKSPLYEEIIKTLPGRKSDSSKISSLYGDGNKLRLSKTNVSTHTEKREKADASTGTEPLKHKVELETAKGSVENQSHSVEHIQGHEEQKTVAYTKYFVKTVKRSLSSEREMFKEFTDSEIDDDVIKSPSGSLTLTKDETSEEFILTPGMYSSIEFDREGQTSLGIEHTSQEIESGAASKSVQPPTDFYDSNLLSTIIISKKTKSMDDLEPRPSTSKQYETSTTTFDDFTTEYFSASPKVDDVSHHVGICSPTLEADEDVGDTHTTEMLQEHDDTVLKIMYSETDVSDTEEISIAKDGQTDHITPPIPLILDFDSSESLKTAIMMESSMHSDQQTPKEIMAEQDATTDKSSSKSSLSLVISDSSSRLMELDTASHSGTFDKRISDTEQIASESIETDFSIDKPSHIQKSASVLSQTAEECMASDDQKSMEETQQSSITFLSLPFGEDFHDTITEIISESTMPSSDQLEIDEACLSNADRISATSTGATPSGQSVSKIAKAKMKKEISAPSYTTFYTDDYETDDGNLEDMSSIARAHPSTDIVQSAPVQDDYEDSERSAKIRRVQDEPSTSFVTDITFEKSPSTCFEREETAPATAEFLPTMQHTKHFGAESSDYPHIPFVRIQPSTSTFQSTPLQEEVSDSEPLSNLMVFESTSQSMAQTGPKRAYDISSKQIKEKGEASDESSKKDSTFTKVSQFQVCASSSKYFSSESSDSINSSFSDTQQSAATIQSHKLSEPPTDFNDSDLLSPLIISKEITKSIIAVEPRPSTSKQDETSTTTIDDFTTEYFTSGSPEVDDASRHAAESIYDISSDHVKKEGEASEEESNQKDSSSTKISQIQACASLSKYLSSESSDSHDSSLSERQQSAVTIQSAHVHTDFAASLKIPESTSQSMDRETDSSGRLSLLARKRLQRRRKKYDFRETIDRLSRSRNISQTSAKTKVDENIVEEPEISYVTSEPLPKSILDYVLELPRKLSEKVLSFFSEPRSQTDIQDVPSEATSLPEATTSKIKQDSEIIDMPCQPSTSAGSSASRFLSPPSEFPFTISSRSFRKSSSVPCTGQIYHKRQSVKDKPPKTYGVLQLAKFEDPSASTNLHIERETSKRSSVSSGSFRVKREQPLLVLQRPDSSESDRPSTSSSSNGR